jgi:hypothetical protein
MKGELLSISRDDWNADSPLFLSDKGLTFTKRAHPFPIKYKYPKKTPSDPNGSSPAQESSSSGRAAQSLVRPPSASSLHNTPSTEPSRHAPIDGLPPSTSSPSSSVSAEAYPPSRTNTDIESSYTTIVPSSYSSSSTTTSRPSPSKRKSSSKGEKGPNGAKDKQAFEKAREEDIKRKAKAQAKGWTAESIEEEFSSRYNQVRRAPLSSLSSLGPKLTRNFLDLRRRTHTSASTALIRREDQEQRLGCSSSSRRRTAGWIGALQRLRSSVFAFTPLFKSASPGHS